MARYKVSNKNIYGLNSGMFITLGICIPVVIALTLIVEFFIVPLFYGGYVGNSNTSAGAAGSVYKKGIPTAASIADMEQMTEGFTFLASGSVLNHDTVRVGETVYHYITLESGETVFAHINKKALTDTRSVGIYLLPVGIWREWTLPEELSSYTMITDTSHYIDMYGDNTPTASAASGHSVGSSAVAWIFIAVLLAIRIVGVHNWRFAPALLAHRDPLLPRNDLECWCAATYALWSHAFGGMEGFPLITGARGTRSQVNRYRKSLAEQWDIHNKEEGLQTVHELTDEWVGVFDMQEAGWDLCRATQLLGMMYLVRMLTRDELDQEFSRAGRVIQHSFSSWDEMVESYLEGFRAWVAGTGRDADSNVAARRRIYERLKNQTFSPYSIPWNTDLTWQSGVSEGERTVTKQLLKNYRGDF